SGPCVPVTVTTSASPPVFSSVVAVTVSFTVTLSIPWPRRIVTGEATSACAEAMTPGPRPVMRPWDEPPAAGNACMLTARAGGSGGVGRIVDGQGGEAGGVGDRQVALDVLDAAACAHVDEVVAAGDQVGRRRRAQDVDRVGAAAVVDGERGQVAVRDRGHPGA